MKALEAQIATEVEREGIAHMRKPYSRDYRAIRTTFVHKSREASSQRPFFPQQGDGSSTRNECRFVNI